MILSLRRVMQEIGVESDEEDTATEVVEVLRLKNSRMIGDSETSWSTGQSRGLKQIHN